MAERAPLGIFTVDERLCVRTWDAWLARATGITAPQALGRPLADVLPDIQTRGLLAILQEVVEGGGVRVLAPAFHHFLFACPPSAPSAHFDRMQQHVTIGPLREDGRIAGAVVTVEDVTARIDGERALAERLRAGTQVPDAGTLAPVLGQDDWHARRHAVAALADRGTAIVDALIDTLRQQHADFSVLSSALDLLALGDFDVVEQVARCLDDADPNLRMQAALILGDRRDRRAVPALMARLDDPDVNVRFHVIEALGRLQAAEAAEALTAIAEGRDFFLAFPALQALTRMASTAVAPRLVPLLADEMLRAAVIEALGELGDEDVVAPLLALLSTAAAPPDVIADALAGLFDRYEHRYQSGDRIADLVRHGMTAAGTQQLLDAVERVSTDRLPALARVLGWLQGEAAQRALTRLLGQERVRAQVVEALVRHGTGVVALLGEQLRAEDMETRRAAAVALGRIGDRRATPGLIAALDDPPVAVAAAGALARIGDGAAFEPLLALAGEADKTLRQAAIAALNSIGHPEMRRHIADLLDDPNPFARESAVAIAGYFGYTECLDRVLACAAADAVDVRRAAVEHLPLFEDGRVFPALAAAVTGGEPAVRAAAAAALARVDDPGRVGALRGALRDEDAWVRYMAVRALGAIGDPVVVPELIATLQGDAAPHVRLAAVDVIGRLAAGPSAAILEPLTRAGDPDLARAAIRALGRLDGPEPREHLERFVHAPEPWRRLAAIEALALRRDPRAPEMLQWAAAAEADEGNAAAAIDALRRIAAADDGRAAAATGALVALAAEPGRRPAAVAALGSLPPARVPDLVAGLRHAAPEVRLAVVEALGRMQHPHASTAVEAALDDAAPVVRLAAVAELKRLGTRASQGRLMTLARTDPEEPVRRAAMMAIARVADPPGAP